MNFNWLSALPIVTQTGLKVILIIPFSAVTPLRCSGVKSTVKSS